MRALLAVLVLAGACTDFPAIAQKVCGNGILEPGEDCDTTDAHCVQCAITCEKATEAMDCPAGYSCGSSGTCAGPSGKLVAPRAVGTVSLDDLHATDVDGDGITDMIGLSATSLTVHFGDAMSPLATVSSLTTPAQTGTAGWGYLDAGDSLDLILPTPDGLVAYTSQYGALSPLAVPSGIGATDQSGMTDSSIQIVAMLRFQDQVFGALAYDSVKTLMNPVPQVVLVVIDLRAPDRIPIGAAQVCDQVLTPDQIDRATTEVYDASSGTDGEFVVSIATTAPRHDCLLNVHIDPPPPPPPDMPVGPASAVVTTITPTAPSYPHRTILANLQLLPGLDACPSLVTQEIHQATGDLSVTAIPGSHQGSGTSAHCTLDFSSPRPFVLDGERPDALVVGRFALTPSFAGIGGDAIVTEDAAFAYVAPNIFISRSNYGKGIYASSRLLKGAVSADLNGDGFSDAVLLPAGTDDLDILYRVHDTTVNPNVDGYQLARFDTAAEVTHLATGDFDGNGIQDFAYTELTSDHVRVMVAYSTRDGVLPPAQVASLSDVQTLMPIGFPSSEDPVSRAEDLILGLTSTTPGTPGALQLTLMLGSASRTLTPVLDPRSPAAQSWHFHNVSIGHFGGQFVDAFGLAYNPVAATTTGAGAQSAFEGWPIMGTKSGLDPMATDGVPITGVAPPCNASDSLMPVGNGVCMDGQTLSVPVDATRDFVIAVDRYGRGGVVDPTPGALAIGPFTLGLASGEKRVRGLFTEHLEDDKTLDLVATFEGPAGKTGAVFACKLDAATLVPSDCRDVAAQIIATDSSVLGCDDATAGSFTLTGPTTGAPPAKDLLVSCSISGGTAIFRISGGATVTKLFAGDVANAALLRSGDIDGDGVPDLVLVHGPPGAQTMSVLRQCSSRDTICQEAP